MTIRLTWPRVLLVAGAGAVLLFLYLWSGAFNVAASSGHWKITEIVLHWVMRNSVKTRAWISEPEQVADGGGLVSAAGHFANACAVCHGAPGVKPSPVMQAAMPPAPDLAVNARQWRDRELYWILDHGVKYSGMPAWGSREERPDEIRRMVAFVRRLPILSPAEYAALTGGAGGLGVEADAAFTGCARCHGMDGRGRGQPDIPVLGGQKPEYLMAALTAYAANRRSSAVMQTAVTGLTPTQLRALAIRFAAMPGLAARPTVSPDAKAEAIIRAGLPAEQLPACNSCHTPGARRAAPLLDGQRATYLAGRLEGWRASDETIDARRPQAVMPVIARRIPQEMIGPLARAYAAR